MPTQCTGTSNVLVAGRYDEVLPHLTPRNALLPVPRTGQVPTSSAPIVPAAVLVGSITTAGDRGRDSVNSIAVCGYHETGGTVQLHLPNDRGRHAHSDDTTEDAGAEVAA